MATANALLSWRTMSFGVALAHRRRAIAEIETGHTGLVGVGSSGAANHRFFDVTA